jgi:outer membrane lipoprotein-sorting protein
LLLLVPPLICQPPLRAEEGADQLKGLEIATEADRRDAGFGDFTCDMKMVLMNENGQESLRIIRLMTKEGEEDGDKTLCIFDRPKDVKGTAFLNYTHKVGDDDQWLYLPALKRVKRISARNKSGSFMGSEFSYEDISSQEIEKYTYRWIRDEAYQGKDCFVMERMPVDRSNSGYQREMVWLDKTEYRVMKIDYYDRKDFLLKTLTSDDYEQHLNHFWRANVMTMVNHQNRKSTRLEFSNYVFKVGLNDKTFNRNGLRTIK